MNQSPAMSASAASEAHHDQTSHQSGTRKPPYFFRDEYANLIVKGNFMTLAARPKMVDEGEWLAHQGKSGACINCQEIPLTLL